MALQSNLSKSTPLQKTNPTPSLSTLLPELIPLVVRNLRGQDLVSIASINSTFLDEARRKLISDGVRLRSIDSIQSFILFLDNTDDRYSKYLEEFDIVYDIPNYRAASAATKAARKEFREKGWRLFFNSRAFFTLKHIYRIEICDFKMKFSDLRQLGSIFSIHLFNVQFIPSIDNNFKPFTSYSLQDLSLTLVQLDERQWRKLLQPENLPRLTRLEIIGVEITPAASEAIGAIAPQLEYLSLDDLLGLESELKKFTKLKYLCLDRIFIFAIDLIELLPSVEYLLLGEPGDLGEEEEAEELIAFFGDSSNAWVDRVEITFGFDIERVLNATGEYWNELKDVLESRGVNFKIEVDMCSESWKDNKDHEEYLKRRAAVALVV